MWGFLGVEDPAWWCIPQHKPTITLAQGKSASDGLEMEFSALATQFQIREKNMFCLRENICMRCCLSISLMPHCVTQHLSALQVFIIHLFHFLTPCFGSLGSHHLHPLRGHEQGLTPMMGFNNWEWKYTEVIANFSSLCSFISTEQQDRGVQKWFGWILAGIPGLPTVPVIYHGKASTQQQAVYVWFPSSGKLSMACFNVKSRLAASQEGSPMQGETGIKQNSSKRQKFPFLKTAEPKSRTIAQVWCMLLSQGLIQPLQLSERTSGPNWDCSDCISQWIMD